LKSLLIIGIALAAAVFVEGAFYGQSAESGFGSIGLLWSVPGIKLAELLHLTGRTFNTFVWIIGAVQLFFLFWLNLRLLVFIVSKCTAK